MNDKYPENESAKLTADDQSKINEDKGNHLHCTKKFSKSITKSCDTPNADNSERVNRIHFFLIKLRNSSTVQVVFTRRKLQTCLLSLKLAFCYDLKSRLAQNCLLVDVIPPTLNKLIGN